jgi:hypothetical protein
MSTPQTDISPRFQLFIVNTGWHSDASQVIEENLENFKALMAPTPLYVLSKEQSRSVLLSDPDRVGTDPCLLLIDQHASGGQGTSGYHGFRLSLGRAANKQEALQIFQTFTRFIVANHNAKDIEKQVRSRLKKEGFHNVFEVLKTVV